MAELKHLPNHRQFRVVQLQHGGDGQQLGDQFGVEEVLPEVDVEDAQAIGAGGFDKGSDGLSRMITSLSQGAVADAVGEPGEGEQLGRHFQMVPRDVLVNDVFGDAVRVDVHVYGASGVSRIGGDVLAVDAG